MCVGVFWNRKEACPSIVFFCVNDRHFLFVEGNTSAMCLTIEIVPHHNIVVIFLFTLYYATIVATTVDKPFAIILYSLMLL